MSAPESYPTRLLSSEVQRLQQYLEMGSTDVALASDSDVQRCMHLLTGTSNVSSDNARTGDTSSYVQHRFRSPRFVGKGSFGIVFLVFDPTLQMDVAIKLLRPSRNSEIIRQRFLEEARITASLTHSGIIRLYDSGLIGDVPYITSEIADDGSLADRIARAPNGLPPRLACHILLQVAEAVAFAHSRLTYHRDIKPGNILMIARKDAAANNRYVDAGISTSISSMHELPNDDSSDPASTSKPVLTDFGLAKRWDKSGDALTMEGDILGTARYMSPEQARGDLDEYSVKSEVFTLGIILFEMLTGTVPFRGNSSTEVRRAIIQDRPLALRSLRAKLPKDLAAIVSKCLEKSPEQRYESVAMLAKDLHRFLTGEPVEASRPSLLRLLTWQAKQHPWLAGSMLVTGLTICLSTIGVSYALWRQYQSGLREHQTKVDYVGALGKLADDVFAGETDQQAVMLETLQAFEDKLNGDLAVAGGNLKLQHLLSVVQHYKSTVLSRSGKTEESMLTRVDSIANLKSLRDRYPKNATYRFQFLYGLAAVCDVMSQPALRQVRPKLAEVIGVSEPHAYAHLLVQEIDQFMRDFDVPVYSEACNSFRAQAALILMSQDRKLGIEQMHVAIRASQQLADKHPESPSYIKGALIGFWALAGDASDRKEADQLVTYAEQANALFEKYLRPHYTEDWVRAEFAIRQSWYAVSLCGLGRYEEAFRVAKEASPVNQQLLSTDATRPAAQLRDFQLLGVQYKSLVKLGQPSEAAALYPRLKSSAELLTEPEFVRMNSWNFADVLQLPDEIKVLLSASTGA